MNKKIMNCFFFEALMIGILGGYICSKLGGWEVLAGFVGIIVSFFSLFVGMTLAFVQNRAKSRDELSKQEEDFQKTLQSVVMKERQLCGRVSINMAKSMSDKIVNRVISKFVDGLSDDSRRNAILSSISEIIEAEFQLMREGILKGEKDGRNPS
jgi:hypothetical protein